MKTANGNEESITLTLPVSIILSSLKRREAAIRLQNERLPEAKAVVETLKREDYPDGHSIKAAQERVRIWKRERRWYVLLTDLTKAIQANPYPGQHIRLYALAQQLIPHISKREWYEIFYWFGITNIMVHTPVQVAELDIDDIERQLIELVNDDNVVPAMALTTVLQCSPNGKQYRTAKEKLTQRGWRWSHQRSGLTTQRVIRPPELAGWVRGQLSN